MPFFTQFVSPNINPHNSDSKVDLLTTTENNYENADNTKKTKKDNKGTWLTTPPQSSILSSLSLTGTTPNKHSQSQVETRVQVETAQLIDHNLSHYFHHHNIQKHHKQSPTAATNNDITATYGTLHEAFELDVIAQKIPGFIRLDSDDILKMLNILDELRYEEIRLDLRDCDSQHKLNIYTKLAVYAGQLTAGDEWDRDMSRRILKALAEPAQDFENRMMAEEKQKKKKRTLHAGKEVVDLASRDKDEDAEVDGDHEHKVKKMKMKHQHPHQHEIESRCSFNSNYSNHHMAQAAPADTHTCATMGVPMHAPAATYGDKTAQRPSAVDPDIADIPFPVVRDIVARTVREVQDAGPGASSASAANNTHARAPRHGTSDVTAMAQRVFATAARTPGAATTPAVADARGAAHGLAHGLAHGAGYVKTEDEQQQQQRRRPDPAGNDRSLVVKLQYPKWFKYYGAAGTASPPGFENESEVEVKDEVE
ncbi:hypothetical protein MKZ38_006147 [Zalerion maritima]|uniref:Uncharacterized protein n=1 Tax=Zalerion maritima TaxID=339359 RepID=A0AAD5RJH4_9PEZI|nr:hypothetical protein MKZ38_006147 [Zalerion maritima]